ncbi:MAG: GNAT family N-acetyltransferase [Candidatus Kariarchaeaceae archaeon]|jgi:ribosomal protein S18 acetylase RimI-like enzyme
MNRSFPNIKSIHQGNTFNSKCSNQIIDFKVLTSDQVDDMMINNYIKLREEEYPSFVTIPEFNSFSIRLKKRKHTKCILAVDNETLVGWLQINTSEKDGENWFNMIVSGNFQKQGVGSSLLNIAKTNYKELCGWIIMIDNYLKRDGSIYKSPVKFYEKNGFQVTGRRSIEYENVELWEIKWKN